VSCRHTLHSLNAPAPGAFPCTLYTTTHGLVLWFSLFCFASLFLHRGPLPLFGSRPTIMFFLLFRQALCCLCARVTVCRRSCMSVLAGSRWRAASTPSSYHFLFCVFHLQGLFCCFFYGAVIFLFFFSPHSSSPSLFPGALCQRGR